MCAKINYVLLASVLAACPIPHSVSNAMPILVIVSPEDDPVYQTSFPNMSGKVPTCIEQLVLHSSLDMVDEKMWDSREMYLKVVDKYGTDQVVSAFVTPTSTYSNPNFFMGEDINTNGA